MNITEAHHRYCIAAIALASSVATCDRIATDPDYPADHGPRANAQRAAMHAEALAEFRAAEATFRASIA